jgi:hypothetical protein
MSLQPPGRGSRLTQDIHSSGMGGSHTPKGKAYLESPSLYQPLQTGAAAKCRSRSLIEAWVVSSRLVVTPAAEWNLSHPSRRAGSFGAIVLAPGTAVGCSGLVSRSDGWMMPHDLTGSPFQRRTVPHLCSQWSFCQGLVPIMPRSQHLTGKRPHLPITFYLCESAYSEHCYTGSEWRPCLTSVGG